VDAVSPPAPDGFRVTDHELTLYGLCAECDRDRAAGEPQ
jgi:Fe2+ or Zn2+ uptake regulation protein